MMTRNVWIRWLEVVLIVVLVYSLLLVFAGTVAGSLFSLLGFGPPDAIDTGMSLALGHPTHALFNLCFGIALAIPLVRLGAS
ncbi:MAG: hypothetical protein ACKOQ7_08555 [Actinomycetota bacterium]